MVCQCKPSSDGRMGCRDECLIRMLNIECVKGTCPCWDLCSNQQVIYNLNFECKYNFIFFTYFCRCLICLLMRLDKKNMLERVISISISWHWMAVRLVCPLNTPFGWDKQHFISDFRLSLCIVFVLILIQMLINNILFQVIFVSEKLVIGVGYDCNPMVFAVDGIGSWYNSEF